jgi:hypothetical protein
MQVVNGLKGAVSLASTSDGRIRRALQSAGVEVVDLQDAPDRVKALSGCSFLVASLGSPPSPNTLIEIGLAIGMRKPVLIIADLAVDVPLTLSDQPLIIAEGLAQEDLNLQVHAFAGGFRTRYPQTPRDWSYFDEMLRRTAPQARQTDPRVRRPEGITNVKRRELARDLFRSDAEFEVASLLTAAGAGVAAQDLGPDLRRVPDLAASFAELGPGFVPLLVEIAGRKAKLEQKAEQLRSALGERGLQLGLLVALDEIQEDLVPHRNVVTLGFRQLGQLVNDGELVPSLRRARNRIVHVSS